MLCGDKYLAGTLGELKAPGAALPGPQEKSGSAAVDIVENVDGEVKEETGPVSGVIDETGNETGPPPSKDPTSSLIVSSTTPAPVRTVKTSRLSEPIIEILNPNAIALKPLNVGNQATSFPKTTASNIAEPISPQAVEVSNQVQEQGTPESETRVEKEAGEEVAALDQ